MIFDEHAGFLQGKPENPPAAGARPWQYVMLTTRDEVLDDRGGRDGTLVERAIERVREQYRHGFDSDCRGPQPRVAPEAFAAGHGDLVVWDGLKVVAVLRPRPDGSVSEIDIGQGCP